jgi:hypothetical protein
MSSSSVVVSSRGKIYIYTYPKFKCNTVSVTKGGKNGLWRQLCECLSEAAAHLPPIVSHLLLQALFIVDLRNEIYLHLALLALFI